MSKTLRMSGKPVRLALIGVATIMLGGCADTGGMGDPFANPFGKSARVDRSPTGTINQPQQQQGSNFFADAFRPFGDSGAQQQSAPTIERPRVQPRTPVAYDSQPLAASRIASSPLPAPSLASAPAVTYAAAPGPSVPLARSVSRSVGGWTSEGGTPVVVAQGENAEMIAQRYGVPSATLLSLNGYANRSQVQPGARLVIPVYHAGGARTAAAEPRPVQAPHFEAPRLAAPHLEAPRAPAPAKLARVEAAPKVDQAAILAEKRAKIAAAKAAEATRQAAEAKAAAAKLAAAKPTPAKLARVKLAEAKSAEAKAAEKLAEAEARASKTETRHAKAAAEAQKLAQAKPAAVDKKQVVAALPTPAPTASAVQPVAAKFEKPQAAAPAADKTTTASLQPAASSVASASDSANPEFRWPARGRVIQAFGAGGNDGINIAVPEGTQVKAAEGGTVAYAGSELKGYGNLVLIRHPNGFVSAYANNGSINVKRGDTVKRGQTIALSGQTGNVASPQLHFELRKGSKPVDPSTYLAGL